MGETGDPVSSREAYIKAAAIARSIGRSDLLTKAALGMAEILAGAGPGIVDHQVIALLEEGLATLGVGDTPQRALLSARLAVDLYWSRNRDRALRLGREAVEMARRVGDPATHIAVLNLRQWMLWEPANLEQRLALATEMTSIAERVGDWESVLNARRARLGAMLEMGEIHEVDAEIAAMENVARVRGHSNGCVERYRTMRALMRGELDEAERWLERLLSIARQRDDRQLLFTYAGQLGTLLGERGRAEEFSPQLSGTSSEIPQLPVVRMALALGHARSNRLVQARTEFEYLAAGDFAQIPNDWNWLGTVALLGEVCVRIGDLERAPVLYRLLSPYAGRSVTLGYGDVYYNTVSHYLGCLSGALDEFDRARREFESSLRFNRRMGAGVALAYTQAAYAAMLLKCEGSDETRQGRELLQLAREAAGAFGLKALLTEIASVNEFANPQSSIDRVHSTRDSEEAIFRREGEVWTLSWGQDTVRLRHLKGFQAIAYLLARPGQEVHIAEVSQILDGFGAGVPSRNSKPGISEAAGDAGPVLDGEAKRSYRDRLRELRRELAEAEEMNDAGRRYRISAEIGFLETELVRAVGLGGRDRRGASVSERIRVRITNVIRSAIARIGENHGAMAEHLRVSIRTGTLCSYSPDPRASLKWKL